MNRTPDAWHLLRALDGSGDIDELTFDRFVRAMRPPHIRNSNVHWREQHLFLVYEQYDDWFLIDDLQSASKVIRRRCGLDLIDARDFTRHGRDQVGSQNSIDAPYHLPPSTLHFIKLNQRVLPTLSSLYNDELREVASEAYASDLDLLERIARARPQRS